MRCFFFLAILATATFAQTSGQWRLSKRNANGTYTDYGLTAENGKAIGFSAGLPVMLSISGGSGSSVWGAITGTLADQTDLNSALNAKLAAASNLSDLANVSTARSNLGLGTLATQNGTISDYLTVATAATTYVSLTGSYANPSWITSFAWSKIASTPTTLSGYGITDAITSATAASTYLPLTGGTLSGQLNISSNIVASGSLQGGGSDYDISIFNRSISVLHKTNGSAANLFFPNLTTGPTTRNYLLPNNNTTSTQTIVTNADTGTVTNTMLAGSIDASKLVGTDIATLGTITTGTWQGSIIAPAYLGTGTSISSKYLRGDGTWQTITGGGDALTTNPLSQFAATTSSQFAGVISDETGSGSVVLASSPTLTTPNLGTPSAVTLTNGTGLPVSTGISGLGTGMASWLATPSSANFAATITDETGSGSVVLASSPTLTTPNLGTPSAVTLTNGTGLPLSTGITGTLAIANGGTGQTSQTNAFDALSPNTTKGDIIVYNGTDNVRLAVGATNGHVLTVDSSTATGVKWAATSGGSGGNWVLISTTTITGSPSEVDFTFTGSYRKYRIELENVYGSLDGYNLRMRTSTNGGSSFDTGASDYGYAYGPIGTYGPVSTTSSTIELTGVFVGNASDEGINGEIDFFDPLNANLKTFAKWEVFGRTYNSAAPNIWVGSGYRDSTADVDAVRIYFSSGNLSGGKIRLFGWSE